MHCALRQLFRIALFAKRSLRSLLAIRVIWPKRHVAACHDAQLTPAELAQKMRARAKNVREPRFFQRRLIPQLVTDCTLMLHPSGAQAQSVVLP